MINLKTLLKKQFFSKLSFLPLLYNLKQFIIAEEYYIND